MIELYVSFSATPGTTGYMIHNLGFKYHNLNSVYCPLKVEKGGLKAAVKAIHALDIRGASISNPHKMQIVKYLNETDNIIDATGSCNTIFNDDGKLMGFNTDGYAIKDYILEHINTDHIYVCGNGGYAKTAHYICNSILDIRTSSITRDNWGTIPDLLDKGNYIFNATPVIIDNPLVINASTTTTTGKELALLQAASQFEIYSYGLELPMQECRKILGLDY